MVWKTKDAKEQERAVVPDNVCIFLEDVAVVTIVLPLMFGVLITASPIMVANFLLFWQRRQVI